MFLQDRDTDIPENLVNRTKVFPEMKQDESGACVAFDHSTGRCGIYNTRPIVCREFQPSGDQCADLHRLEKRLEKLN